MPHFTCLVHARYKVTEFSSSLTVLQIDRKSTKTDRPTLAPGCRDDNIFSSTRARSHASEYFVISSTAQQDTAYNIPVISLPTCNPRWKYAVPPPCPFVTQRQAAITELNNLPVPPAILLFSKKMLTSIRCTISRSSLSPVGPLENSLPTSALMLSDMVIPGYLVGCKKTRQATSTTTLALFAYRTWLLLPRSSESRNLNGSVFPVVPGVAMSKSVERKLATLMDTSRASPRIPLIIAPNLFPTGERSVSVWTGKRDN